MPASTRAMSTLREQALLDAAATGLVWVVRHGERADVADPDWDPEAVERPHDPPLTELGVRQAMATGLALRARGARVDAVYTSPFLRCVQTAAALADALGGVELRVEPGLSELAHAEWFDEPPIDAAMGTSQLQLEARRVASGARVNPTYVPLYDTAARSGGSGGASAFEPMAFPESNEAATARYEATLRTLRKTAPFSVIVTHGYGVWVMCEEVLGRELWEDTDYCCLTRMRQQAAGEPWRCEPPRDSLVETAHLQKLPEAKQGGLLGR